MVRKIVLTAIIMVPLVACDNDFRQGSCDEGFYQQNDGNGGYFCAPIAEEDAIDTTRSPTDNLNETD